jgi:HEAT repeat protein
MWELCRTLSDGSEEDRKRCLLDLIECDVLDRGCEQAVRDGSRAQGTLEWCYEILSSSEVEELFKALKEHTSGRELAEILCQLAAARAAIEAQKRGEGTGTTGELLEWLSRASGTRIADNLLPPPNSPALTAFSTAGWVAEGLDWLRLRKIRLGDARNLVTDLLAVVPDASMGQEDAFTGNEQADLRLLKELAPGSAASHSLWELFAYWQADSSGHREDADHAAGRGPKQNLAHFDPFSWVRSLHDEHLTRLTQLLRSPDDRVRMEALTVAWDLAYELTTKQQPTDWGARLTPDLLAALAALFQDPVDSARRLAVSAAGALSRLRTHPAVQEGVLPLLRDPVEAVRATAAAAATLSNSQSQTLLLSLGGLLDDPSPTVRRVAALCLARLELDASVPGLIDSLERALASPDGRLLTDVLTAIGQLRPGAPPALIAVVSRFLDDPVASIRAAAVRALTRSLPTAGTPEVFAALTRLLDDPDKEVRAAVAGAIGACGKLAPSSLREGLGHLLLDRNANVIQAVGSAICQLGRIVATQEILDRIVFLLPRKHGPLLISAIRALGQSAATPAIQKALARRFSSCPEAFTAAEALGRRAFRQTIACFAELFRHPTRRVRDDAVRGAMSLGSALAVPDFLDEVVRLLHDMNADTRATAAAAVEAMGAAAATPAIRDALDALLEDAESYVRYKVEQAIRAIDPDADIG